MCDIIKTAKYDTITERIFIMEKARFAMLFSGGKDSAMALGKMIEAGHTPVCIVVSKNTSGYTHMHMIRKNLLNRYSEALGLPIEVVKMRDKYDFEIWEETVKMLIEKYKIDALCSGDIAFEYSIDNQKKIAEKYGIKTFSPLWGIDEESAIKEVLKYKVIVKCIGKSYGLDDIVGKTLTPELIEQMHSHGLELTDDTAVLHTLVFDGPIFSHPVSHTMRKVFTSSDVCMIDII